MYSDDYENRMERIKRDTQTLDDKENIPNCSILAKFVRRSRSRKPSKTTHRYDSQYLREVSGGSYNVPVEPASWDSSVVDSRSYASVLQSVVEETGNSTLQEGHASFQGVFPRGTKKIRNVKMVTLELNLEIKSEEDKDFYIGYPARLKDLIRKGMFYNDGNYMYFHATAEFSPLKVKTSLLKEHLCPRSLRRQRGNLAAIHRRRKRYFHDMLGWYTDRYENNLDKRSWKIQCKHPNPAIATIMYYRKSHPDDHLKFLLDYLSWNQRVTRFNVKVEAFTSLVAESDIYKIEIYSNYPILPTIWTLRMERKDGKPFELEAQCTVYNMEDIRDFELSSLYDSKTIHEEGAVIQQVSHSSWCGGDVSRWDVQIFL